MVAKWFALVTDIQATILVAKSLYLLHQKPPCDQNGFHSLAINVLVAEWDFWSQNGRKAERDWGLKEINISRLTIIGLSLQVDVTFDTR